jgi:TonB family protein
MKTKIIFAISMLVATFAFGQNQDLQEIKVTAPQFRSDLFQNINDFLLSGIEYPVESLKAGDEGTEVIQFVVTPKGNVTDIVVINSVSEIIDLEVKRILEITSGMWTPGAVNGEPVAMEKEISVYLKSRIKVILWLKQRAILNMETNYFLFITGLKKH